MANRAAHLLARCDPRSNPIANPILSRIATTLGPVDARSLCAVRTADMPHPSSRIAALMKRMTAATSIAGVRVDEEDWLSAGWTVRGTGPEYGAASSEG